MFFLSALAALLSNAPLVYQSVPAQKIRDRVEKKPPPSARAATRAIALGRLDALESAKKLNGVKGWSLAAAMLFEALAVGCVAKAVGIIL